MWTQAQSSLLEDERSCREGPSYPNNPSRGPRYVSEAILNIQSQVNWPTLELTNQTSELWEIMNVCSFKPQLLSPRWPISQQNIIDKVEKHTNKTSYEEKWMYPTCVSTIFALHNWTLDTTNHPLKKKKMNVINGEWWISCFTFLL